MVQYRFGTTQTNNWPTYRYPVPVGNKATLTMSQKDGTVDSLFVNGTLVMSESGKYSTIQGTVDTGVLGNGYQKTFFRGDIAEVLVYNRVLSDSERRDVENYLNTKYFNP
jgi:hypothetical protein